MASLSIQSLRGLIESEQIEDFRIRCILVRQENKLFCERQGMIEESKVFREMTEQEKMFMRFFQGGYSEAVACSSLLEMRAKRDELQKIAQQARITMNGYDKAIDEEEKKGKPTVGFSRTLNSDDVSSDAINRVKTRQEKLTKGEKLLKQLMAAGMSEADAMSTLSNGNLLNQIRSKGNNQSVEELKINEHFDKSIDEKNKALIEESKRQAEIKSNDRSELGFFNPFEKKE